MYNRPVYNRPVIRLRHLAATLMLVMCMAANADIPAGYYSSLNGKSDGALKTAVYNVVHNFTQVSSYSDLPKYFQQTDVYPESKRWWDMYSDIPLYAPSFSGLNREHSFPKSWWGGLTTVPAYVDLNHLYPSEAKANMAKSNYPLGEVDKSKKITFNNGITIVGYPVTGQGGGAAYVFEPDKEYKGDFARTYFYMATTYQDLTWKYTYMVSQNLWPTLNAWSVQLLLKWHREDPVSEKEVLRNEAVYKIQNNRNPFIDYPQLAEYIWGSKQGQPFNEADAVTPGGKPELVTPVQDMVLEFGQVAVGKSATARLWFKGNNLSSPLSIAVYRGDKELFTVPTRTIAANLVNGDDGYWLPVTYTPLEIGEHTSRLLISEGGLSGSRGIELRGECLPVPELGVCTAEAATEITETSYIANWTAPSADVIDYYVVTRTRYVGAEVTEEKLDAEGNYLEMTEFDKSDSESYSVQSARLGYLSRPSNLIFVKHAGVDDIMVQEPLVIMCFNDGIRFIGPATHTNVVICDSLGRVITVVSEAGNNTDVQLPAGVYLIVSDQCRKPVKAIVY